jgi:hypothetical protein
MLPDIPFYVTLIFILSAIATGALFIIAIGKSDNPRTKKWTHAWMLGFLFWLIFLSVLAVNGYFMDRKATPPNVAVPVMIFMSVIALSFLIPAFRRAIDSLSLETLTWLHIVRIPIEFCLYWLFLEKQVPESMTFSGINFDILSGLTAPLIAWAYFRKEMLKPSALLVWNFLCLGLLFVVVIRAVGAVPSPGQLWDFQQPNFAVLHFPFVWLPGFIVPLVFWSHLIAIRRLTRKRA